MTDMESLNRAVEEAWADYDMHEWERDRWLEKYPTDGEAMWDEWCVLLKLYVEAAVSAKARAEERERLLSVPPWCTHPKSEVYWAGSDRFICAMCGAAPIEGGD